MGFPAGNPRRANLAGFQKISLINSIAWLAGKCPPRPESGGLEDPGAGAFVQMRTASYQLILYTYRCILLPLQM